MSAKISRVLIIGINYYPEDTAIGLFTTQKAEYLVDNGYDVTVITGFPYYPQWKIREDYSAKPYFNKETINGVKVFRSKQYVPSNPTFLKRILHLVSFTFGNFVNLFRISKPDIVISIIPFTTSALLGWFLKIRFKSKLWLHIQDFEFDAAIDSGLLQGNKKAIIKGLLWVEKKILSKADVNSTISNGMINKLKQKSNVKSYYLTNWIDVSLFEKTFNKPHTYLDSKNFKILYSGNIGAKQDWDFFFEFINEIKNILKVEVIIVGEGAEKKEVIKRLKPYKFVKHYNLVPFDELPLLLSSADIHVLFQKKDVIDTVMPSKLLGMMASGKPSIVTGHIDSEVATVLKASDGGLYFNSSDIKPVIEAALKIKNNPEEAKKMGKNARRFVVEKYSKKKVLSQFERKLNEILDEN
jgi:colanic acid biosynthesis glycosyl transferase WcaI